MSAYQPIFPDFNAVVVVVVIVVVVVGTSAAAAAAVERFDVPLDMSFQSRLINALIYRYKKTKPHIQYMFLLCYKNCSIMPMPLHTS